MAAEFPDQTSITLDMALDVCHYDEGRARTLIQSMATTQQAKQIVSRWVRSKSFNEHTEQRDKFTTLFNYIFI